MLWNGYECGKNYGNENIKATVPSPDYDRLKKPKTVEYFNYLPRMINKMST
jgi:hypothetical protein